MAAHAVEGVCLRGMRCLELRWWDRQDSNFPGYLVNFSPKYQHLYQQLLLWPLFDHAEGRIPSAKGQR